MTEEEVQLIISDGVKKIIEDRHIVEADIKKVIALAETDGKKLRQQDGSRFMVNRRLDNYNLYVEYSRDGNNFTLLTTYSHRGRMKL